MALHGKDTSFTIDNSIGTPVDISEHCDNVDFPGMTADISEVSVFQRDSKNYVVGQLGGTISISGPWDATVDAVLAGIVGKVAGTFSYVPGGGTVTYSGEAFCTSYQISSPNGPVTYSANFTINGDVGRA